MAIKIVSVGCICDHFGSWQMFRQLINNQLLSNAVSFITGNTKIRDCICHDVVQPNLHIHTLFSFPLISFALPIARVSHKDN